MGIKDDSGTRVIGLNEFREYLNSKEYYKVYECLKINQVQEYII